MIGVRAVGSEVVKYRRSSTRKLLVLGPAGLILSYSLVGVLGNSPTTWTLFLGVVYNWWPVLWIPLGAALFAALSTLQEARSGAWRALRVRSVPSAFLYGAKLAVLALHTLLGTLLLVALVLVAGVALIGGLVPWETVVLGALLPWLAALPILALQLWVAEAGGVGTSIAVGVIGFLMGAMTAETENWAYVPWAWPIRIAAPFVGVHANGLPLAAEDPLRDAGIVTSIIALSLISCAVIAAAGSWWFSRREVR